MGAARLGQARAATRGRLGPPNYARRRVDAWCLIGKGELRVAYVRGRARAILTSGRGHSFRGVARGDRMRRARRRLEIAYRLNLIGGGRLLVLTGVGDRRQVWLGARKGRIRWLMVQTRGRVAAGTFAHLVRRVP